MILGCFFINIFILFRKCPSIYVEILTNDLYSVSTWQILENKKLIEELKDIILLNASEISEVKCLQFLSEEILIVLYLSFVEE